MSCGAVQVAEMQKKGFGMDGIVVVYILVLFVVLAAWIAAIFKLVEAAQEKGHYKDGAGILWFIGIFATPIVVGLITASLPDRSERTVAVTVPASAAPKAAEDELPEI